MEKQQTIYCGSGKKMNDKWLKVTINPDKLRDYIQEFSGNKFIRLNINIKDEADQYGKDVSISVDTWKPEEKKQSDYEPMTKSFIQSEDDLPF
ncbi:MAG: hypothetical protein Unbinned2819contig1004_2 [Prokaryotic dsDNA virus sp.]|nr:MAG: hypothetical protein Unbinned2819contig1004_2 [Prokaryotic dsDNA virus sp.]|tara:strand:+ start:6860 stop:7138 length:279 start_codon:yes stop_codon:yes gene_type:complete